MRPLSLSRKLRLLLRAEAWKVPVRKNRSLDHLIDAISEELDEEGMHPKELQGSFELRAREAWTPRTRTSTSSVVKDEPTQEFQTHED